MHVRPRNPRAGFTLVELLIGLSLSLMIMSAVLSSYVFLGKNFTRSLGISSFNQPTLEAQSRRALAYFAQDVRMATGLVTTLPAAPDTFANMVELTVPGDTTATTILYYYNFDTVAHYLHASNAIDTTADANGITLPAATLTRVNLGTWAAQTLHTNLLTCVFSYYDNSGQSYTVFDSTATGFSSLSGIKQISLAFTSQAGSATNGTLTQVYSASSARLLLRNRAFSP